MIKDRIACPCCGFLTLESYGHFDLCELCFWEDDLLQRVQPDYGGGANVPCLNEARENFRAFGACEREALECVRPPIPEEKGFA